MKLLREDVLTRIYAPMVMIQGLQESGVFKSMIASAPMTLSKEKFLSTIKKSNSSTHPEPLHLNPYPHKRWLEYKLINHLGQRNLRHRKSCISRSSPATIVPFGK